MILDRAERMLARRGFSSGAKARVSFSSSRRSASSPSRRSALIIVMSVCVFLAELFEKIVG